MIPELADIVDEFSSTIIVDGDHAAFAVTCIAAALLWQVELSLVELPRIPVSKRRKRLRQD